MAILSDSGTLLAVLRNLPPWPPKQISTLLKSGASSQNQLDSVAKLDVHPDGHLSLEVNRLDGTPLHHTEFQRVKISGEGLFRLEVTWEPGFASLRLNGQVLAVYSPDGPALEVTAHASPPGAGVRSFDHPDAAKVCHNWVENRKKKFAVTSLRQGRRPKTVLEQARDLLIALNNLRTIERVIRTEGKTHQIGLLAAELRALLYWTKDDKSERGYNPLLLRLASKADLPLPVYAFREASNPAPPIILEAPFHCVADCGSVVQTAQGQLLMDFQELLMGQAVVIRMESGGPKTVERKHSVRDAISETANSLGASHYDEDVSEQVGAMQDFAFLQINALAETLCSVARPTVDIGDWVLSELGKRNLIDVTQLAGEKPF